MPERDCPGVPLFRGGDTGTSGTVVFAFITNAYLRHATMRPCLSAETRSCLALSPWLTTNPCLSARKCLFTCHLRTRIFPGRCPAALSFITSLLTIYVPWQVSRYLEAVHPGHPGHTGTDSLSKCPDVRVPAGTNL
jgi:hypothetical protein